MTHPLSIFGDDTMGSLASHYCLYGDMFGGGANQVACNPGQRSRLPSGHSHPSELDCPPSHQTVRFADGGVLCLAPGAPVSAAPSNARRPVWAVSDAMPPSFDCSRAGTGLHPMRPHYYWRADGEMMATCVPVNVQPHELAQHEANGVLWREGSTWAPTAAQIAADNAALDQIRRDQIARAQAEYAAWLAQQDTATRALAESAGTPDYETNRPQLTLPAPASTTITPYQQPPITPAPSPGDRINYLGPPDVACTADAKICPDGSAVGRTGPNCEFAPCPQATTTGGGGNIFDDTVRAAGSALSAAGVPDTLAGYPAVYVIGAAAAAIAVYMMAK